MPAPRTSAPPAYNQSQPPQQEYRTQPRRPSGFTPAVRVGPGPSQPPAPGSRRGVFDQQQPQEEQQVEIINQPPPRFSQMPEGAAGPLTKSGYPDRRFRGQRDLPPQEEQNPDFHRARTGGMIGEMHVTVDGKPDRRFKENRGLSDEEVMARWADEVQARFGRKR